MPVNKHEVIFGTKILAFGPELHTWRSGLIGILTYFKMAGQNKHL